MSAATAPTTVAAPKQGLHRPMAETGFWSWITTVDHKKLGIMYAVTALVFFVVGGLEVLLVRLQLAQADGNILTASQYNQLFTMHGTTMVFLVVMPIAAAFGNYLVPLMIGARDVAFPRINALGYWTFLFGGLFLTSSFFLGGAPDCAWVCYAPLSTGTYPASAGVLAGTNYLGSGVDFWALGILFTGIGSLTGAVNFIVTIFNMRAPGMDFMRMPVFVWMMLIISFLLLFSIPVVTVPLIEIVYARHFDATFFDAAVGGDPLVYQHLFWIFGHPEVYILILPAMGIVSEVLPTFSRKPLFGYSFVVFSGAAIGFMGFGVWAHHMFTSGLGPMGVAAFSVATMFIAVPTGVKIFNWLGTIWGGSLRLSTPMLFALGFIAIFVIGGLSGVTHAVSPHDRQQHDTYYIVAHFHYVLFGGAIFGIFSGVYFWFPKMFGRYLSEGLGKIHFWLMLLGMNLTFGPMHILGLQGQPRRTYTYSENQGWEFWNMVATIGAFIIALSILVFIINAVKSRRNGEVAPDDAWDGRTMEWSIPSPPPVHNFDRVPHIEARDNFWHQKYTEDDEGRMVRRVAGASADAGDKDEHIHMPSPSFWPFLIGLSFPFLGWGIVFGNFLLGGFGALLLLWAVYGWAMEPSTEPDAEGHDDHGDDHGSDVDNGAPTGSVEAGTGAETTSDASVQDPEPAAQ